MRKVIKRVAFYFLVFYLTALVLWLGHIFGHGRDAAILMYHSVGSSFAGDHQLSTPLATFEKQMRFLSDHRYRVVTLSSVVELLKAKKAIPAKTVVLTFDDGYEDNYTVVFPILKKYGFPATVFVITDYIAKEKEMYGSMCRFMTPQMLREMSDSGLVTIGSHTRSHFFLPDIKDPSVLEKQVAGAKIFLEDILGRPVDFFCYPSGGYDKRSEEAVRRAGYKAAVTTLHKKKGFAHKDLYALKRIKANRRWMPFRFFFLTSGYYLRMKETTL